MKHAYIPPLAVSHGDKFKIGDRVTCDAHGEGVVWEYRREGMVLVKFGPVLYPVHHNTLTHVK